MTNTSKPKTSPNSSPIPWRKVTVPASDGFPLHATLFPSQSESPVVVIHSGMAILQPFYFRYARFLQRNGFSVITFDCRGLGGSRPPEGLKKFQAKFSEWGEKDLTGILQWIRSELKPSKLLMIGHSGGGQVAGLSPLCLELDGLMTVTSQLGYWRYWPAPRRYIFAALWYVVMPLLSRLIGYFPAKKLKLAEDIPRGVALQWASWCRHPEYLFGFGKTLDLSRYPKFEAPILSFSFEDDTFAPPPAVAALLAKYSKAPIKRRHFHPKDLNVSEIGHFGFFRESFQETLWKESLEWLKARLG